MFNFDFSKPIVDFSNFEFSQLYDAFIFGASILLVGITAIFSVLCILWIFITIFKLIINDLPKIKKTKKKEVAAPIIEQRNDSHKVDDGELIAVISAAIAMAESDSSGMKFKVVSFKRV